MTQLHLLQLVILKIKTKATGWKVQMTMMKWSRDLISAIRNVKDNFAKTNQASKSTSQIRACQISSQLRAFLDREFVNPSIWTLLLAQQQTNDCACQETQKTFPCLVCATKYCKNFILLNTSIREGAWGKVNRNQLTIQTLKGLTLLVSLGQPIHQSFSKKPRFSYHCKQNFQSQAKKHKNCQHGLLEIDGLQREQGEG